MSVIELMLKRRSIRQYTNERVSDTALDTILKAGLLAPSSRGVFPVEFIVVRDKNTLAELASAKTSGADMLSSADCAVVVFGDTERSDVWTEDCSLAMIYMHLAATELGIGSCWIQCRSRLSRKIKNSKNITSDEYVRELLNIPERYSVEAILSLGVPAKEVPARREEELLYDKIHKEKF